MAIIGIDLGTTTCEVSYMRDGKPFLIPGPDGKDIFTSAIAIDNKTKELLIGELAKRMLPIGSKWAVEEIKRLMGSDEKRILGDRELSPIELSAILLKHLKKSAEEFVREPCDRVVITVPANFEDKARNDTKLAGELAGFKVERIVNEPTAAALVLESTEAKNQHLLVFDLGGGTFDVSIIERNEGVLEVKSSSGDRKLGGKDFDRALAQYVRSSFLDEHGVDIFEDKEAYFNLLHACEVAKKELSYSLNTSITIPNIASKDGKPLNLDHEISRVQFESLIAEKITATENAINDALSGAKPKLSMENIDLVLLIGGSTRIPFVREFVNSKVGDTPVSYSDVDPERAVAMGAALQASIIDGDTDTIIMDCVPFSLGTSVISIIDGREIPGLYSEVIPANSPMQRQFNGTFLTVFEDQESVLVEVIQKSGQNDSIWAKDHLLLGSEELSDIPPGPAGQEIEVSFLYNLNGLLDVKAKMVSGGQKIDFKVDSGNRRQISEEEFNRIWEQSEHAKKVKTTIQIAEKRLTTIEHEELKGKVQLLKEAVISGDQELIAKLDDEINDLLFDMD
jgi:molecular chaperone DnaK